MSSLKYKIKYQLDFLKHCNGNKGHNITEEDKRLKEIVIQNYFKSGLLFNVGAVYLNYIRRNKTFMKTVFSNF